MKTILLKYQDSSGSVTERRISEIEIEDTQTINAFCHLRNERRSFKIDRILHLVDFDSGEIINPYSYFVSSQNENTRPSIDSLAWHAISAIKALKFFTLTTRGFKQSERQRVTNFVLEVVKTSPYSPAQIDEWVYKLWCGDLYRFKGGDTLEYTETLRNIPASLLGRCRDYALNIASGSGRKPVDPACLERIETEFCANPVVKPPVKTADGAL